MKRNIGCHGVDHRLSRRGFLAGSVAGAAALGLGLQSSQAEQLKRGEKRILQIYLQGGLSQLESWDPKPGTLHGGPFRAIATSVPGIHISELLPQQRRGVLAFRPATLGAYIHGHVAHPPGLVDGRFHNARSFPNQAPACGCRVQRPTNPSSRRERLQFTGAPSHKR